MKVAALLAIAACSSSDLTLDPASVHFAGRDYVVSRFDQPPARGFVLTAKDDARRILGQPDDARHLAPCPPPHLMTLNVDGDDRRDLVLYSCGFIWIFLDRGELLSATGAIEGKRKEGHWVRPDPRAYPGLEKLVPIIAKIDPE